MNRKKNIKYNYYKNYKDIKDIIEKRFNILIILITVVVLVLFVKLFYIQIVKKDYYSKKLKEITENTVLGNTAPRGRIYDRNHKIIVDNEPSRIIFYQKPKGIKIEEEINLAYILSNMLDIDYSKINDTIIKTFWINSNLEKANKKITKEELKKFKMRKLTLQDLEQLKYDRVTKKELNIFNKKDKEAAYIYYLMNKGYYYSEKIIKDSNITDEEYAVIASNVYNLKGVNIRLDWNRIYPYKNVFRTILENVSTSKSGIPSDLKNYYLEKGYSLNDRVGISYLEYQYDDYLKGKKDVYEIGKNKKKY